MTTRERWIVYPLLFLSLGLALRDKVIPPEKFAAERIFCREIDVLDHLDDPRRPQVKIGVDGNGQSGVVETFNAEGKAEVRLFSVDGVGTVAAFDPASKTVLLIGSDGTRYGLFAMTPDRGRFVPLTLYEIPRARQEKEGKPEKKEAEKEGAGQNGERRQESGDRR